MASMGSRMKTQDQLNMSWTVAPANDLRKVAGSVDWVKDTMVLVTEVPMLAPMMIGIDCFTDSTIEGKQFIIYKLASIEENSSLTLSSDHGDEEVQHAEDQTQTNNQPSDAPDFPSAAQIWKQTS